MRIVVTGARGLVGWHTAARLHAENCAARFRGDAPPVDLITLDHAGFDNDARLADALQGADAVLHFAGVNRGEPDAVEAANPAIARRLADAVARSGAQPHIVYANSTHAQLDTPYGRSKRIAGEVLGATGLPVTDLVLPHIFGECARPNYNNVTATLTAALWNGTAPTLAAGARVQLLHAGAAAREAIGAARAGLTGTLAPAGRDLGVDELWERLSRFHADYQANIFPVVDDPFDLALFNAYRTASYPDHMPFALRVNRDQRGDLFETARSRGGSQTFVSTTHPGQRRGDHFHTDLVERFLVVSGRATIRLRKVLTDEVTSFHVSGDEPMAVDMPPLHTHHIENDSDQPVVTYFWAHRMFDPANPDTFADPVLRS